MNEFLSDFSFVRFNDEYEKELLKYFRGDGKWVCDHRCSTCPFDGLNNTHRLSCGAKGSVMCAFSYDDDFYKRTIIVANVLSKWRECGFYWCVVDNE